MIKMKVTDEEPIYRSIAFRSTHMHACSQHKARIVIDEIRERSYEETLMIIKLMPYRISYSIFELVYSATANTSHNIDFNETS